jgi:flagellar biosynthesis/type III secretory pathway protein FliH
MHGEREELLESGFQQALEQELALGRERALAQGWGKSFVEFWEQGFAQGFEQGWLEGLARGRAESILRLLAARGVFVDEAARQRILTCRDRATLNHWFDKSMSATSLSAVLDNMAPSLP